MKSKRNLALAALAVAAGAILILTQTAWSDRHHQPFKLEGSWLAKGTGAAAGQLWNYSYAPSDPSGREATFQGGNIVGDPTLGGLFPEAEHAPVYVGRAVMTKRNEAAYTVITYGVKRVAAVPEVIWIGVDSGTIKSVSGNKTEVAHSYSVYLGAQDADGDGLPDEGQSPIACVPFQSLDTQLPLLPPCQP
jgi:hypothetical protein